MVDIFIEPGSGVGLAEQVYEQIRGYIMDGRLESGDRLPPTRELSATLGVSRHTITTAYGRLSAEGYLDGLRGGGTVVSDLFHHGALGATQLVVPPFSAQREEGPPIIYDLRPGAPDRRLFPATEWKRYVRWAIDEHDAVYQDAAGIHDVRLVLARWVARSRGVDAGLQQVIVTSGAQQALFLLVSALVGPGDEVAVEDPGYRPFRRVVETIGARVVPVPVDAEGIVVDAIPASVRIVYVTPSHQFPTGVTMSMRRRLELLALAGRHEMLVIEDDYDSEYRYVDRPIEPLSRLDRHNSVAYVAGFSKILSPALRLGFAVLPPHLMGPISELRQLIDWAPSAVDQLTLRGFIADGRLDRHLRRVRRVYQGRHERVTGFLDELADQGLVHPPTSQAGLHVSVRLEGGDEADIVGLLAKRGVAIDGFESRSITRSSPVHGLVLGFGSADESELAKALPIIGAVLESRP